jgi:hypothetical protein
MLVSPLTDDETVNVDPVNWVLVVEKEVLLPWAHAVVSGVHLPKSTRQLFAHLSRRNYGQRLLHMAY